MTASPALLDRKSLPAVTMAVTGLLFVLLYTEAIHTLVRDWVTDPEASHGLLVFPLALYMAWKSGLSPSRRPSVGWGALVMVGGLVFGILSAFAAELFTMRLAMWITAAGIVISWWGPRQLLHWWLPAALLVLAIPLPSTVVSSLALPLQLQASEIGAALLRWRQVPVVLSGNVIDIPGRSLFVTEACSGLRSLNALLAIGLIIGGNALNSPWMRGVLLAITIPIAVLMNGFRVFVTAYLVYYVDPSLGEALMHYTEGWILFVVSFAALCGTTWLMITAREYAGRLVPGWSTAATAPATR